MSLVFVFSSTKKKHLESSDSQKKQVKIDDVTESKTFKVPKLLNFSGNYKLNSTETL